MDSARAQTRLAAAPLLVRLCRETSYDLPDIAAYLSVEVAKGTTSFRQLWHDAFGANCVPKTEREAADCFWLTAGAGAVRTLGLCLETVQTYRGSDPYVPTIAQVVTEGAVAVLRKSRLVLADSQNLPHLAQLSQLADDVLGDTPHAAAARKRLARRSRRAQSIAQRLGA